MKSLSKQFSKRFSQYDEIYTQLKSPKAKSTQKASRKTMISKLRPISSIDSDEVFLMIFKFFNVIEIFIASRVCKKWKNLIDQNPEIFKIMDLVSLPKNVSSLNLIKIVGKAKKLEKLFLPESATISDTSYFLMMANENLEYLQLNNLNLDFTNVFVKEIKYLTVLDLINKKNRTKILDDNELKSLTNNLPNLRHLYMNKSPIENKSLSILLPKFNLLETLSLLRCPHLANSIFSSISKHCTSLKRLEIGGSFKDYNFNFSLEGFKLLNEASFKLEILRIEYCVKVGDKILSLISEKFNKSLKEFHVVRNCFEKCSKISDQGMLGLKPCINLEKLTICYSRKLKECAHLHIARNLHNLIVLNLKDCILQEDLSILKVECPKLEEVNLSGNSWVKSQVLIGLSKHGNLRILHLGHFEHSENSCDQNLQEYPPKGMFIESLFKQDETFLKLHTLHLEQECSLTYWLDIRIKKLRPSLSIKYTQIDHLLKKN